MPPFRTLIFRIFLLCINFTNSSRSSRIPSGAMSSLFISAKVDGVIIPFNTRCLSVWLCLLLKLNMCDRTRDRYSSPFLHKSYNFCSISIAITSGSRASATSSWVDWTILKAKFTTFRQLTIPLQSTSKEFHTPLTKLVLKYVFKNNFK